MMCVSPYRKHEDAERLSALEECEQIASGSALLIPARRHFDALWAERARLLALLATVSEQLTEAMRVL